MRAIELFVFVHRRNNSLQAIFTAAGRIIIAFFIDNILNGYWHIEFSVVLCSWQKLECKIAASAYFSDFNIWRGSAATRQVRYIANILECDSENIFDNRLDRTLQRMAKKTDGIIIDSQCQWHCLSVYDRHSNAEDWAAGRHDVTVDSIRYYEVRRIKVHFVLKTPSWLFYGIALHRRWSICQFRCIWRFFRELITVIGSSKPELLGDKSGPIVQRAFSAPWAFHSSKCLRRLYPNVPS